MHTEKQIATDLKYKGHIIDVFSDTVELENGKTSFRDVVRHKGAVCVAPVTDSGEFIFVQQFRYPINQELLELPAGKLDTATELPLDCAHRELEEETGMRAREMIHLGTYIASSGFCDEKIELFLAKGLFNGVANPDDDEFIDVIKIPVDEAVRMVMDNKFVDGKTQLLILKAAKYISEN